MAYTAPDNHSVIFNFDDDGYAAPAHNAVNFAFTEAVIDVQPVLILGHRHSVTGMGAGTVVLGHRYGTVALEQQYTHVTRRYATLGGPSEAMRTRRRYATNGIGIATMHATRRYGTFTSVARLPFGKRYATLGNTDAPLPYRQRYAAEGAPSQALHNNQRFALEGITVAPLLICGHRYAVAAPTDQYLFAGSRYATFTPASVGLPYSQQWGYTMIFKRGVEIVYGSKVARAVELRADLGLDVIKRGTIIDAAMLVTTKRGVVIDAAMKSTDSIARDVVLSSTMTEGATIIVAEPPTVTVRGQTLILESVEVRIDEGEYAYTCQLTLAGPAEYNLFGIDEPFTITLGAEQYKFIRQEPRLAMDSQVDVTAAISGIGPAAFYAEPRADKITRTWDTPTLVSDVLAELFDSVELRVLDWSIPAGRLAVDGQTPMDIAQNIARATGGLIESEPDGTLYIRYQWPVSVPQLADVTPEQIYDDAQHTFKFDTTVNIPRAVNKVRVMDSTDSVSAILSAEIDAREDGYNTGRTSFIPGDQPALLIFRGERVSVDRVRASAGTTGALPPGTMHVEETLTFADTREASLQYPTAALTSYVWLGNDLGVPVVVDGNKVRVPGEGVGVLMVEYEAAFLAQRLSGVPAVLNGETEYDVLVLVEGSQQ